MDLVSAGMDIGVVCILLFNAWQGYRKGIILSAASVIIFFISLSAGMGTAAKYANDIVDTIEPVLNWVADDATDEAAKSYGRLSDIQDTRTMETVAKNAFEILGVHKLASPVLAKRALRVMDDEDKNLRESISAVFLWLISWILMFATGFAIAELLLTLVVHFIATVFTLPPLGYFDKIGGPVLGFVNGFLLLSALGWALRYTGILLKQETLQKTGLLEGFINAGFVSGMIKF